MVIENADHPDIRDFIDAKRREDARMRDLAAAGHEIDPFTPSGEKTIAESTSFQNANVSIGASDDFMKSATGIMAQASDLRGWELLARTTGDVVDRVSASELLNDAVDAAWTCGDPGMVFLDTANAWHTTPSLGPITTCNPCAETWLNDDSSCNLASLNLVKFLRVDGTTRVEDFRQAVDVMILAMDITCSFSDLPTPEITKNTRDLRQLGLGYSNLGAALMAQAMPYDSEVARNWAGSITALLTGRAYHRSGELARRFGPYAHFNDNRQTHLGVILSHNDHIKSSMGGNDVWGEARNDWDQASRLGKLYGFRNSQVTVLAPCGTISYLMDCDTTGIEPDFSLVKHKGIAGGGNMVIVNRTVPRALRELGYPACEVSVILEHLEATGKLSVSAGHQAVFDCANDISPMGHLMMVSSVQPFLSGAPSKTINLPNSATRDDIRAIYVEAWKSGCKAVSVYRDGSKATQVLTSKPKLKVPTAEEIKSIGDAVVAVLNEGGRSEERPPDPALGRNGNHTSPSEPVRLRLPSTRESITHKFEVGGHEGYITAGKYADGKLGEFFLTGVGKEGSFVQGMMSAWSIACSIDFQYGVPLEVMARKFIGMEFEPNGFTGNTEVPHAKSIPDYVFRWLVARFCDADTCQSFGVLTPEVKKRMTAALDATATPQETPSSAPLPVSSAVVATNGHVADVGMRPCPECGGLMVRSGSCYSCSCGANTGCG